MTDGWVSIYCHQTFQLGGNISGSVKSFTGEPLTVASYAGFGADRLALLAPQGKHERHVQIKAKKLCNSRINR